MPHTLLLVDDEKKVTDFMADFLEQEGYRIITADSGREALRKARDTKPSLVVLDWMMPDMNGLDVCRELRAAGPIGIIMVTARITESDKIIGLEMGADDYLTKPFSLRELAARIRSVMRRIEGAQPTEPFIEYEGLKISESQFRVWKHGAEIPLTPTEFKLLLTLAARTGVVYSRLQLLRAAADDVIDNDERTADAHISRIRKKIEDDPAQPFYIKTVYGFGYKFGDRS